MTRWLTAALVGLMCVLAPAGCAPLADLNDLRTELESAGYDAHQLNHTSHNGEDVLTIDVTADDPADADAADRVAEIAWTHYPAAIDRLVVTVNGQPGMAATAAELTDRFGERPADLTDSRRGGPDVGLIVGVVVAAALLAGLLVLVWWRGRRPPPPVAPPPGYQLPHHYPPQPPQGF